jgi:hypothetical protein
MPVRQVLVAAVLSLMLLAPGLRAEEAGKVIRLQGSAEARDGTARRALAAGDPVREGESLHTGPGSRLLVRFGDGMELTLGDGAEMAVTAFQWDEARAAGRAELALAQGSFLLHGGAVGKLPEHPLTVKTPLASVGVRGTQFWGGPLDAPLSILLIEGAIVVSSPGGTVDLGTPGEGTSVSEPGEAPRPPSFWGEQRIGRAFATVSFGN